MSMALATVTDLGVEPETSMTKLEAWLLTQDTTTYSSYYNGKMSYKLAGKSWQEYVDSQFPDLTDQATSENVFKTVIDLYAENLVPKPKEMKGFSNCLVPLLTRGEAVVVVDRANEPHYAEHFEVISDGRYTVAAIFTRNLADMKDYITFAYSDGKTRIFEKDVPDDMSAADKTQGFTFQAEETGSTLYRFALDDKGFGASLAALQDRLNHSILDQTAVEEMYARPFWYLLNTQIAPTNPYLPPGMAPADDGLKEYKSHETGGHVFVSSSEGPFGQLTPPTITDMISYHDSIVDKAPQAFGIPGFYFKPGSGTPPTGVALMVLSKRFNNKVSRMREDLQENLEALAAHLGVPKKEAPEGKELDPDEEQYDLWPTNDDLMQEALDAHGIALSQMGYPLGYIAEVVTPGVDLDDYEDDSLGDPVPPGSGQPADMTATGQQGLTATPGQVQAYGQNPGQVARS
jgi:hypothetical protein